MSSKRRSRPRRSDYARIRQQKLAYKAMKRGEQPPPAGSPFMTSDIPDWASGMAAMEGFESSLSEVNDKPVHFGWLRRFWKYVRSEFAQFVAIVGGTTPFYFAGDFDSVHSEADSYLEPGGSGGYGIPYLVINWEKSFPTYGEFTIVHEILWGIGEYDEYSFEISSGGQDFFLFGSFNTDGSFSGRIVPPDIDDEEDWLPWQLGRAMNWAGMFQWDPYYKKLGYQIAWNYEAQDAHWSLRFGSGGGFTISYYTGIWPRFSAGLQYTWVNKWNISEWAVAACYEDQGSWAATVGLNPGGVIHGMISYTREYNLLRALKIGMATKLSWALTDTLNTEWETGLVIPWMHKLPAPQVEDHPFPDIEKIRENVNTRMGSEEYWDEFRVIIREGGYFGWRVGLVEAQLMTGMQAVSLDAGLDVGVWDRQLTPYFMVNIDM